MENPEKAYSTAPMRAVSLVLVYRCRYTYPVRVAQANFRMSRGPIKNCSHSEGKGMVSQKKGLPSR